MDYEKGQALLRCRECRQEFMIVVEKIPNGVGWMEKLADLAKSLEKRTVCPNCGKRKTEIRPPFPYREIPERRPNVSKSKVLSILEGAGIKGRSAQDKFLGEMQGGFVQGEVTRGGGMPVSIGRFGRE